MLPPRMLTPEDFDRDRIARARAMRPSDKLELGPDLFDMTSELVLASMRSQFPTATETELLERFRARLRLASSLDQSD